VDDRTSYASKAAAQIPAVSDTLTGLTSAPLRPVVPLLLSSASRSSEDSRAAHVVVEPGHQWPRLLLQFSSPIDEGSMGFA